MPASSPQRPKEPAVSSSSRSPAPPPPVSRSTSQTSPESIPLAPKSIPLAPKLIPLAPNHNIKAQIHTFATKLPPNLDLPNPRLLALAGDGSAVQEDLCAGSHGESADWGSGCYSPRGSARSTSSHLFHAWSWRLVSSRSSAIQDAPLRAILACWTAAPEHCQPVD